MHFLKLFSTLLIFSIFMQVKAQYTYKPVVVLELFTSQGCSSCPIADELLEELKETYAQEDVFVLSYHVDYWNRLGWKDPFSQKAFSDYQSRYATAFRSRNIYTPQLVVNGTTEFVGGNKLRALETIKKYQTGNAANTVDLQVISKKDNEIEVNFKVAGMDFKNLTLAVVVAERTTNIPRGENRNRTLKNANIVAVRNVIQTPKGTAKLSLPDWITDKDTLSVVAYTQDAQLEITGASRLSI